MSVQFQPSWRSRLAGLRPKRLGRRIARPKSIYFLRHTLVPLSDCYGSDRGTPVDRYFIDRFVQAHRDVIRGRCLEIGANHYTVRFGGAQVTQSDIVDIDPDNTVASIIGDLQNLPHVPDAIFDCVLATQVLPCIERPDLAVAECARITKPNGTVLLTVSCLGRVDPGATHDFWRFTTDSVKWLFEPWFAPEDLEITTWGNVRVGLAHWVGKSAQELTRRELEYCDPSFPCVITVKAFKGPATQLMQSPRQGGAPPPGS